MPLQSHGRICVAVTLCLVVLFLLLKSQYLATSHDVFKFTRQYAHSGKTLQNGISNDTLGVSVCLHTHSAR
jgi:hypothetical protein